MKTPTPPTPPTPPPPPAKTRRQSFQPDGFQSVAGSQLAGSIPREPTSQRDPSSQPHTRSPACKIWLTNEWYIPVDEDGYVAGNCFDGAFGCVVEVFHHAHKKSRLALKVPRMLADTVRENAYIWQMLAEEKAVVESVNQELPNTAAVVSMAAHTNALLGPRQFQGYAHCQEQHGGVLFFSFLKNRRPRIASVCFEKERSKVVVYPKSLQPVFEKLLKDPQQWERLQRNPETVAGPPFSTPSYVEHKLGPISVDRKSPDDLRALGAGIKIAESLLQSETGAEVEAGKLIDTFKLGSLPEVWYCGVDSILYNWATGTLQEAFEKEFTKDWTLTDYYRVITRILQGLVTLHELGHVHADVRPANILALGPLQDPDSFCVADYGSFSRFSYQANQPQQQGFTLLGAGPGKFRSSVFYAPERRGGIERETANMAVILDNHQTQKIYVLLGWSSDLANLEPGEFWEGIKSAEQVESSDDRLQTGDRLRIRDYVFDVVGNPRVDAKGQYVVYECSPRFARVMHERMAVFNQAEGLPSITFVSLPSYVEMQQWSVATDLYGISTIALYGLFRHFSRHIDLDSSRQSAETFNDGSNPTFRKYAADHTSFSEMVETLENRPNAQQIWADLETFCTTIEADTDPRREITASPGSRVGVDGDGAAAGHSEKMTVLQYGVQIAQSLLSSHPAMECILEMFQGARVGAGIVVLAEHRMMYNVASFLFFVHFVMSCMHRRSYLGDVSEAYPFCSDRREAPRCGADDKRVLASTSALGRMKKLYQYIADGRYSGFFVKREEITGGPEGGSGRIHSTLGLRRAFEKYRSERLVIRKSVEEFATLFREKFAPGKMAKPSVFAVGDWYDKLQKALAAIHEGHLLPLLSKVNTDSTSPKN